MGKVFKWRNGIRPNQYQIVKGIVYMLSRNDPSVVIKFDQSRLEEVLKYSWSAHPFWNGEKYICHRYRDDQGNWKVISLGKHLGYGRGYKHQNGDAYDFTSTNMVRNIPWSKA